MTKNIEFNPVRNRGTLRALAVSFGIKKVNVFLLSLTLSVFGFYLYQTISISSGNVALVALKKEFLDMKNGNVIEKNDLDAAFAKETLGMTEIERFDYMMVGRDEFAATVRTDNEN